MTDESYKRMQEYAEDTDTPNKFDKFEQHSPETVLKEEDPNFVERLPLVIRREKLAPLISGIAETYADCVAQTFGPGGYDTIIEMTNGVITTKDGWTVARNLTLRLNADLTALGRMVLDVAANVNLKVGDATTTAILVANELNQRMQKLIAKWENEKVPMYKIKKGLEDAVDTICKEVMTSKVPMGKLTEEQRLDTIYNVALVSSNWNTIAATVIREIYEHTKNPYIRVERSGGTDLDFDIVHGYDMKAMLCLPEHYVNVASKQAAVHKNPIVLMFDFDVRATQMTLPLTLIGSALATKGVPLVVVAPGFENDFIKGLNRACNQNGATGIPIPNLTCVKIFLDHQGYRDMYRDFSIVLGANLIGNDTQDEFLEMCNDVRRMYARVQELQKNPKADPKANLTELKAEMNNLVAAATNYALTYGGSCKELTVTNKAITAEIDESIWTEEQVNRVKDLRKFVEVKLNDAIARCESLSAILMEVDDLRTRYSKLSCNSGVIKVGGYGDGDIKARMDALDDAISACRSVYENGYVIGGNYAIPAACYRLRHNEYPDILKSIIQAVCESFLECIYLVHQNYYGEVRKGINDVIETAISENKAYNIITDTYDPTLIESPVVSTEILRGSMRLVKLVATSNQYVYKKYTVSELIGADDIA